MSYKFIENSPFISRWFTLSDGRTGICRKVKQNKASTTIQLQFGADGPFEWRKLTSVRVAFPNEVPEGIA